MRKNSSSRVFILFAILFFLILFAYSCKKSNEEIGDQVENHEDMTNKTDEAHVPISPKVPELPTLDKASLNYEAVLFSKTENVNLSLKDARFEESISKGLKGGMTIDSKGYTVLGGLRDDPNRYKYEGEVAGGIHRLDNKELITEYKFHVIKIIAGKTERFKDAYLVCKGTYWIPFPMLKPEFPWEDVPSTYVWYEVSTSGILLNTNKSISREYLQEKGISSIGEIEPCFILTSDLQPALFGKGSIHLLIE